MIVTTPGGLSAQWASSDLTLPSAPSSPRTARRFLVEALDRCQVAATDVDLATLLTSELVTNAVRYGRGVVRLRVRTSPPAVRVEVHDDNPTVPTLGPDAHDEDESGRGLRLVEALASRWGADPVPGRGKDVWFEIDLRED